VTVAAAYAQLGAAQKGRGRGAPAYSLYVNRPVGRVIAAGAYAVGLTPNQVTAVSAGLTFTGIVLLATVPPSLLLGVVVWLLLAAGYAWDSADGQVARLRGGGSLAGEWLDHVVDAAKLVSLHVAVAVGAFRFFDAPVAWILVPLGFAIVATVAFFGMILNDLLRARAAWPRRRRREDRRRCDRSSGSLSITGSGVSRSCCGEHRRCSSWCTPCSR
jgi:phosphatidylglycerophosphate synthase